MPLGGTGWDQMSGGFDLSSLPMLGAFGGGNMDQQGLMRAMYAQALMRNASQPAPQTTSPWGMISNAVRPMAAAYAATRMMPGGGGGSPWFQGPGQQASVLGQRRRELDFQNMAPWGPPTYAGSPPGQAY